MADVKVCDRCGKRLDDVERSTFSVKQVAPRFVLSATLFKRPTYYSKIPDIVNTQHDLCMDCTVKLSDWMQSCETEEKV